MDRRQLLTLAAAAGLAPSLAQGATGTATNKQALRIVTSHLPPLVLQDGGTSPGALHELVTILCHNLQLEPAMRFVPWSRAIYLARMGPATAIFPLTRLPNREALFRWLAPLYEESYAFLAARNGHFDILHPERMRNSRIALLRGASQLAILRELGYRNIVEASSLDEVHRFLVGGMADAAFGERAIIANALRKRSAEDDFHTSVAVRRTTAWLAASLDYDEVDASRFQRAIAELLANGTQRRILEKYQLV